MTVKIKELKIKADFTRDANLHSNADERYIEGATSSNISHLTDRINRMANNIKNRRER